MIYIAIVLSFVGGFVDAIAGGGGIINVPTLIFLGLPIDQVLGTSKLVSTSGTAFAAATFIKKKKYSHFVISRGAVCTLIGASTGALCVSLINPEILKPIVSFLVIVIAIYFFFKPQFGKVESEEVLDIRAKVIIIVAAVVIGFYDGIFGPGTGAFYTFIFVRLVHQNFIVAVGNTKILNLVSNVVALIIFIFVGNVVWEIGIPMALSNMLGGYCGAHYAIRRGSSAVRWIFIIVALLVGLKQLL